jgi:two-component system LytT family response regulator
MDGFEVLRSLPQGTLPSVIFLTAYEQHALRAFEVQAVDYLLKPVDDERFAAAISRARKLLDSTAKTQAAEQILRMLAGQPGRYVSRLPVRTGSRIQIVHVEDVEWIGAAGDYAELHTRGQCHLLRETMNALEQKLDPAQFMRVHRSRIVRTNCIRELRSMENREYVVKLSDRSEHRSSRTYSERLEAWMSAVGRASR